jgi:hypothetical protein
MYGNFSFFEQNRTNFQLPLCSGENSSHVCLLIINFCFLSPFMYLTWSLYRYRVINVICSFSSSQNSGSNRYLSDPMSPYWTHAVGDIPSPWHQGKLEAPGDSRRWISDQQNTSYQKNSFITRCLLHEFVPNQRAWKLKFWLTESFKHVGIYRNFYEFRLAIWKCYSFILKILS